MRKFTDNVSDLSILWKPHRKGNPAHADLSYTIMCANFSDTSTFWEYNSVQSFLFEARLGVTCAILPIVVSSIERSQTKFFDDLFSKS